MPAVPPSDAAPAEGDRFVAGGAPAAPTVDAATALARQAAGFGGRAAEIAAPVAGLTPEATLRAAAQLFDVADRMHERIMREARQARDSGAATVATYRRLAMERGADEERLRELRRPFAMAELPPGHRAVMNGLLSSHDQVFATSGALSTVADMYQLGRREGAERLLDTFLASEHAQRLLVGGNGYRVFASRRELASSLVVFLTQGGQQRWVDRRLVMDIPSGTPFYGETSPLFRHQPWPPSPDDIAMRTVLGILGWNLKVERSTSHGLIFHLDFGATMVEAPMPPSPAPGGGSFGGVVEEGGSVSGAGGEGAASAKSLEDADPSAVMGAEAMVGADAVPAAIVGVPPPPTLVK